MKRVAVARGGQEAEITQCRDHSLADPCILNSPGIEKPKLYLSVISSDHSVVASSPSGSGGLSVLEARKFHHCGSSFVVPTSGGDDDPLESAGLSLLDAV